MLGNNFIAESLNLCLELGQSNTITPAQTMESRVIHVAAAQMGATHYHDPREKTLNRMLALLEQAADNGANLVVFPEAAFTTFFPRHLINDPVELDSFFEHGDITMQPQTRPLFDQAKALGVDITVGFAEKTATGEAFNSCIYYHAKSGAIISKYRKVHLPGDFEPFADPDATNQLEKRYFKPGDLGFNAFRVPDLVPSSSSTEKGDPILGMMICNDRRWAESWRVLGLQGVEVVLCGYNTAGFAPQLWGSSVNIDPDEARNKALLQHKLVMQAHSYTNSCFSISAARCGLDDGKYSLIGGSCITGPGGEIIAEASTTEDEIVYAEVNLDECRAGKEKTFDFARHRRIEHYRRITEQVGVVEPDRQLPAVLSEDGMEDQAAPVTAKMKKQIRNSSRQSQQHASYDGYLRSHGRKSAATRCHCDRLHSTTTSAISDRGLL